MRKAIFRVDAIECKPDEQRVIVSRHSASHFADLLDMFDYN